jgi:alkanesulfonate monooxygenase SsuD/methylene tetrahydromethanopterin reductase-like flavin-dependent oxidoreductase (luciferase family)
MGSIPKRLPSYHPSVLLKLYIYGDLNRVQSSRRLEETLRGSVFIGSPDTVVGKLKDLQRDIGLSDFQLETNCAGLADHTAEREAIRLLAREVKSA